MASKLGSYWKNFVMNFYDHKSHPAFRYDLWANCPIQAIKCDPTLAHVFFHEFFEHTDGDAFTSAVYPAGASAGTDGVFAGVGGWYRMYSDSEDNDEKYNVSTGESWLFAEGKKLWFECKIKLTEATTDNANWIIGLMQEAGENAILDDGGGPAATYDGAVFYKVDGTLSTMFESSNDTTQATATTMGTFVSGTAVRLGFYYDGAVTTATITPYINGVAKTAQTITNSGLLEMELFFGVKSGGAGGEAAEETLEVDWIKVVQLR